MMNVTRELEVHECPVCFVTYAGPKRLFEAKRKNGSDFYCPNGHSLSYRDNENDRIRRERDRLKQEAARQEELISWYDGRLNQVSKECTQLQKDKRKLTARAAGGACPCCNRSFVNMARHMKTKHPEFQAVKVVA